MKSCLTTHEVLGKTRIRALGLGLRFVLCVGSASLLAPSPARTAEAALPACLSGPPVTLVVRIGDSLPRRAWLRGGAHPALSVVDAQTGVTLWSAAALPPAAQTFDPMRSAFAGSLLPVDLDGDGLHDRLYAGDLAGRLWRFDLHHGQPPDLWASGGVFADLSVGLPRGFLAPPDVSLPTAAEVQSSSPAATWFNISLGTAAIGGAAVDNRFYVVRDRFAFESWSQTQYDRWSALREQDLVPLPRLGAMLTRPAPDGYFIVVGGADILSPTLTVSGRATLALAGQGAAARADCAVAAVISAIDLATGREIGPTQQTGSQPVRLSLAMTAAQPFTLLRAGPRALCMLGATRIPHCDADLSPRLTWWRREDAD